MNKGKKENLYLDEDERLKEQFGLRSKEFNISANWISDKDLIQAHVDLAGGPCGEALDLCCGTGQIGRALKEKGWNVRGLDITNEMVKISSQYFPTFQGKAADIPFESDSFHLVVCRQSFHFLNIERVLSEVGRVLISGGIFVVSLTVPFSDIDRDYLFQIHKTKQPLLQKFYTSKDLIDELNRTGFMVEKIRTITVREFITRWMHYAPELTQKVRENVCSMIKNAPLTYKKLHRVETVGREIFEDWNWVVIRSSFYKR